MTIAIGTLCRRACVIGAALGLSGCLNLNPDPPELLLTLTPIAEHRALAGAAATGRAEGALVVREPRVVQRLNYARVPVQMTDTAIAYLENAFWVDKPAKLFQQLVTETLRARTDRLVLAEADLGYKALTNLTGQLLDLGYDAPSRSVTVRFDAVLETADGRILTRRFESTVDDIPPDVSSVGPALNVAANAVAGQIAEWVAQI